MAIVESIIFLLQRNLDVLRQTQAIHGIVISGGLSRQVIFCQLLADLSRLPVERSIDQEATARGACYILAAYPQEWLQPDRELFTPRDNHLLQLRFSRWSEKMQAELAKKQR